MTTIIIDRKKKVIAADKQATWGNTKFVSSSKIIRGVSSTGLSYLAAAAGDISSGQTWFRWVMDYYDGKVSTEDYPKEMTDFEGVVLFKSGLLLLYLAKPEPVEINARYSALGSGSDFAVGAMEAGATLEEAIRIASKHDLMTGMGVRIEQL